MDPLLEDLERFLGLARKAAAKNVSIPTSYFETICQRIRSDAEKITECVEHIRLGIACVPFAVMPASPNNPKRKTMSDNACKNCRHWKATGIVQRPSCTSASMDESTRVGDCSRPFLPRHLYMREYDTCASFERPQRPVYEPGQVYRRTDGSYHLVVKLGSNAVPRLVHLGSGPGADTALSVLDADKDKFTYVGMFGDAFKPAECCESWAARPRNKCPLNVALPLLCADVVGEVLAQAHEHEKEHGEPPVHLRMNRDMKNRLLAEIEKKGLTRHKGHMPLAIFGLPILLVD